MKVVKFLALIVVVVLLAGAALAAHTIWFKPLSIDWYFERVFVEFALDDPELLSSLGLLESVGLDFHNDDLTDRSINRTVELNEKYGRDLEILRSYDRDSLAAGQQLSYDILESYLATAVAGAQFPFHHYPVTQIAGPHMDLPDFLINTHRIDDEDGAEHYLSRLSKLPEALDQVMAQLEYRCQAGLHPPNFVVEAVIDQIRPLATGEPADHLLVTELARRLDLLDGANELNPIRRKSLLNRATRRVANGVQPAYQRMLDFLVELEAEATENDGVWALPDGAAYYQHMIRRNTTTDMTAAEIHEIGLAEVERISEEMDRILASQDLVDGSVGERMAALALEPRFGFPDTAAGAEEAISGYAQMVERAQSQIGPYFGRLPKASVEVRPIPEFKADGEAIAYYQPPSMDGSRPGVFFLNTARLSEMTGFGMHALAYHEAVPGHHLQIALQQEIAGGPTFRKLIPFTAYSEGWALYAERLASEIGLITDPFDDLGRLQGELFRAVRLVVDTGIHDQRWSREKANEYMRAHTGSPPGEIAAEVDRYFVWPAQALAYKVGMMKILDIRERSRQQLGDDFDLADFHDQLLGGGAMPLDVLENVILD